MRLTGSPSRRLRPTKSCRSSRAAPTSSSVLRLLRVQCVDEELRLLSAFFDRIRGDDLLPVGPCAIDLPLRLQEVRQPAFAFGKFRDGFVRLLIVRDRLIVSPLVDMSRGARVERSHQRPLRIGQRRQAVQHLHSRPYLVQVRGQRSRLNVFGQQAGCVAEPTFRFGAVSKVEDHCRVSDERRWQRLHLRAEDRFRHGRPIGSDIVLVRRRIPITLLQDRVIEPRDRLWIAGHHGAPVTGL